MSNFDFSNMTEKELVRLAEQIQEEIQNYKDRKLDKARQAFFKAYDEVIEAGGIISYYGDDSGEPDVYSMAKKCIYIS